MSHGRSGFGRRTAVTALAAAAALTLADSAGAVQRYASTTGGTTEPCAAANPCDLPTAMSGGIAAGDEVVINPGTYALGASGIAISLSSISVHGVTGQAKPLITGNPAGFGALFGVGGPGSSVADLVIDHFGTGGGPGFDIGGAGSIAERIEVTSTAGQGCQIEDGALLRDSLCIYNGNASNSAALFTGGGNGTTAAQNVTAIGNGANSDGLRQLVISGATTTFNGRNLILAGGDNDIEVATVNAASTGTVNLAYSNWDEPASFNGAGTETATPVGSPTNQTAPPIFVNAAGGNYRQALGSPTIDAGAPDASTGTLDFEREARPQGLGLDIGGDELAVSVPPPADTTPPETTIDKGPKKKGKSKKATFTFSSSEAGSTFVCKVDKKAEAPCTSPLKLKRLKPGKHTFKVVATDAAGNADATAATYSWKVKRKPKA